MGAANANVQFFASSHQNSKHMSPSGSDFTSSDNYSSVTDFCSVIDSNDYKRIKRRNKVSGSTHKHSQKLIIMFSKFASSIYCEM